MPSSFEVRTGGDDDTFVLSLYGDLDLVGQELMQEACDQAIRAGTSQIVVDLGTLTYIDSTGLGALLSLSRLAHACDVRLVLLPGPPEVQRLFALCGLTESFSFLPRP